MWTPTLKDPLMTNKFMEGVVGGFYWLPRCDQIKIRFCADCPPKHELV